MNYNHSLMTDLQTKSIDERINISARGMDFDYRGYDVKKGGLFVKSGVDANVNRVLFWLASKRFDYTRSALRGGVLYDLLGILSNDTNLQYWEEEISKRFNAEFSNDLGLIVCRLSTDRNRRILRVNMVVQDRLNGKTFPVNTEARL